MLNQPWNLFRLPGKYALLYIIQRHRRISVANRFHGIPKHLLNNPKIRSI
jgi:hypothetical protein